MNMPDLKEARKRTNKEVLTKKYKSNLENKEILKNKTFYLKTYGCQMNEHDSENMKAILKDQGMKEVIDFEDADLIMLNTCSIRENAHNKVFGMLGRIKHLKQIKKDIIVGITGCMAQEEVVANEIKEKYKWMDFVLGTHNIHLLADIVADSFKQRRLKIEAPSIEGEIIENLPVERQSKYKAFVNIMYGCDKFCTYCIVPYTRGKQRSRNKDDIINEVKDLIKEGYQEVTLLGQNVNAYGKDRNDNYNMANLLEDIAKTNIPRIRFMTSHPWDFTDEMIDIIAKYPNIMPSIHLPVQSGNTDILKLMGRRYTKEDYLILFNKLKTKIKNVAISTDIIVGFPNETEEQFQDTIDLVNECKFDLAYTFIYSKRVGTPAEKMKDNITIKEKEQRLYKLNDLINKYALENNKKLENKIVPVLVEAKSEKEGYLMGYSDTNKLVNLKAPESVIGKIVNVKILDAKTWSLNGEYVE
ncbi:MAG: tRNA (N6-isopentenyl adenosine(37)-C2)-methylthiotransferase MiaB [Bacilli bacterium]